MTESIIKSKAARTTSGTTFVSDASQELILTVVVRFIDVKDALTHHCGRASSDTMVFILLCKVPVKNFLLSIMNGEEYVCQFHLYQFFMQNLIPWRTCAENGY